MVVVFIVLVAISYLIEILRVTINGKKDKKEEKEISKSNASIGEKTTEKKETFTKETVEDEELVAVIAAAIAASLGTTIPQINIKTIKRISPTTPAWSEAGRREQILEKL